MKATQISDFIKPEKFLVQALQVTTVRSMQNLLSQLPIVSENEYPVDPTDLDLGWKEGKLHWFPLGRDRGNAGRIKLANSGEGPIAERTINSMEALIELERRRERKKDPTSPPPSSPREAVMRYFALPSLDQIPRLVGEEGKKVRQFARLLAKKIEVRVVYDKVEREFRVSIRDEGIGQSPARIHQTLLSLGSSDKGDKPYLIGLFGQGGSSSYAASEYSWCISRRVNDLLDGCTDGVGWTVIKQVIPKGRRDPFYAYLAASPAGEVVSFSARIADQAGCKAGTKFAHLGYNFSGAGSAVMRRLYYMLNHILYNPVLPFDLYAGSTQATIYGNGYRLTNASVNNKTILDKVYSPQQLS